MRLLALASIPLLVPVAATTPQVSPSEPGVPDIVLIVIDDLGWGDLGCTGHPHHRTPALDGLAAASLVFDHAYAAAPNCAPSRASLQTGRVTPRHGIHTVGSAARGKARFRRLVPIENRTELALDEVTLAEVLDGHDALHVGKWHLGASAIDHGFERTYGDNGKGHPKTYFAPFGIDGMEDVPEGTYLTDALTRAAVDFVREERSRPYFLHFSPYTVHTPIQAPADRVEERQAAGVRAAKYAAMVEAMDAAVGRLLEAIDETGGETVVVFTSDNGGLGRVTNTEPLRGNKGTLDEGGVRVPLFVRWPGRVSPGRDATPVHHIDVLPTLAALAGVEPGAGQTLDGVDLGPRLAGGTLPERALAWHFPCYLEGKSDRFTRFRTEPGGALRVGRWKLVEFFAPDGASRLELYDLAGDPREARDLSKAEPERTAALRARLRSWRRNVGAWVPQDREPRFASADDATKESSAPGGGERE